MQNSEAFCPTSQILLIRNQDYTHRSGKYLLTFNVTRYILKTVIKSFRDKETGKVYSRERSAKLPGHIQQIALRKLRMVNNAHNINDLRIPPSNRLEKLGGKREGQYSIRINDQWLICFVWKDNNAYYGEITDYH